MKGKPVHHSMTMSRKRPEPFQAGLPPVSDPALCAFLDYWISLRGDTGVPDRRQFDATRLPTLLSRFWIVHREAATGRYRFLLAGEEIRSLLGTRVVGEYVDVLFPDHGATMTAALDEVTGRPAVRHIIGPLYRVGKHPIAAERLVLPMADNGVVDTAYGATVYHWPASAMRTRAQFTGDATGTTLPVDTLPRLGCMSA